MGQYHYLVNLDKKQIIHPCQIGNGMKLREQIGWHYSTATALVMLLAASNKEGGRGGGDFRVNHPLLGSWAGDRIAFVGDYAASTDLPGLDAPLIYEQCKAVCDSAPKGDPPPDWEQWTNISTQVREMLAAEFHIRYGDKGWCDIVQRKNKNTTPKLCPDMVITRAAKLN